MRELAARLELDDVAHLIPVAVGGAWYPGRYFDPLATLEPHLGSALAAIDRAVALAGVPEERIVLAGFSQGACLVAEYLAGSAGRPFAGGGVLTGALFGAPSERASPTPRPGLPMAFASSRHDEWIAFADAQETADRFRAAGAQVTFTALEDRVHAVSDEAVSALRALLV